MISKSWSSLKYPIFRKIEAEAKVSQDISQHLKAEISSFVPTRLWALQGAGALLGGGFCKLCAGLGKCSCGGELGGTRINQAFH